LIKKRLAVAFTGKSNSGKTTLIEKISKELIRRKKRVLIIKNDPKDKAIFDYEGKDSDKFYKTGADVFVTSPNRTTLFSHSYSDIDHMISISPNFDYLLVEGLKTLPLPRIGIFRDEVDTDYIDYIDVVATDSSIEERTVFKDLKILDLNSPESVIEWIDKNGKEI